MTEIAIFNGPNLSSLGIREPMIYGNTSAVELEAQLVSWGIEDDFHVIFKQFDQEGQLVTAIQELSERCKALIINPGGLSHTSVAVLDSMRAFEGSIVEIHISQIHNREPYRHRMLTASAADVVVAGAGIYGYLLAIKAVKEMLGRKTINGNIQ